MLKRSFRNYALSLAGGALLLGGSSVAAGAMILPLPGVGTEQSTAAIVTDGAGAAKVEQIYWRGRGYGWPAAMAGTEAMAGAAAAMAGTAAMAGAAAGGATGTLIVAAVGNTARRSPKACSASKALRVTFGATTPRSSLKFGHLCRQRTSSPTSVVSHVALNKVIRGVFTSVPALERAIHTYIERNNSDPKPFVWTKSAHDNIGNVNRGRAAPKTPSMKRRDKL